ncbi:hypothetical protein BgiMline_014005, partial [Biomphalaria glabrata]
MLVTTRPPQLRCISSTYTVQVRNYLARTQNTGEDTNRTTHSLLIELTYSGAGLCRSGLGSRF